MINHDADSPRSPERGSGDHSEVKLATMKPSTRSLVPTTLGWFLLALALTMLLLGGMSTFPRLGMMLSGQKVVLALAVIWMFCLLPVLLQFLVLKTTSYGFTNQRLEYTRGIFNRRRDQIEIVRIRDITTNRSLVQRLLGLGTIQLDTVDRSHPLLWIPDQPEPYKLADWIHQLNTAERQRLGYREFEGTQSL